MTRKRQSLFGDIAAAFMLLSRIPVPYRFDDGSPPDFIQSLWAFPLVGFIIGFIGGLALALAHLLGLPNLFAGGLCLGVMAIGSGAMHEDGLADMADGFGGGHSIDDKMRIMHDSHIGSYGVLTICLCTIIRIALFAEIANADLSTPVMICLVAAIASGGRGLVLLALRWFPIAAGAKLAKVTGRPAFAAITVGASLWFLPLAYLTSTFAAIFATSAASVTCILLGKLAMRQIKGISGDVMGAIVILGEITLAAGIYMAYLSPALGILIEMSMLTEWTTPFDLPGLSR